MDLHIWDKKPRAIVTGAASGIGAMIYKNLKKAGIKTLGVDISYDGCDIMLDLASFKNAGWVYQSEIDLLINCAGIFPLPEPTDDRGMKNIFNVNFWGTYYMIQSVLPKMKKGLIINIASVSGIKQEPDEPIYAASKAAVISLTKSLAIKLAPNIRVNCISPGFYNTNLVPGDAPKELIDNVPLGYEDKPENLWPVIKMIMTTPYLTGANIVVDGGLSL